VPNSQNHGAAEEVSALKTLTVVPGLCRDCSDQACVQACIENHNAYADFKWGHLFIVPCDDGEWMPIVCGQCAEAECMNACNRKAWIRNQRTGAITLDKYGCNLCGLCVSACPKGLVSAGSETVHKCDLCKGTPKCVSACARGALLY
jgi:Fe-S-cluster-containing hydrogenase component 2